MRFRVKKPKLATVHHLPVASRLQRSRALRRKVRIDLSKPITREAVTTVVYQLRDAWGYMMVFQDDDVARVEAMLDQVYVLTGELFIVVPNLPTVVHCLLTAGNVESRC
jgi:hypothetical protein